jgi:hypothetical protein
MKFYEINYITSAKTIHFQFLINGSIRDILFLKNTRRMDILILTNYFGSIVLSYHHMRILKYELLMLLTLF